MYEQLDEQPSLIFFTKILKTELSTAENKSD